MSTPPLFPSMLLIVVVLIERNVASQQVNNNYLTYWLGDISFAPCIFWSTLNQIWNLTLIFLNPFETFFTVKYINMGIRSTFNTCENNILKLFVMLAQMAWKNPMDTHCFNFVIILALLQCFLLIRVCLRSTFYTRCTWCVTSYKLK